MKDSDNTNKILAIHDLSGFGNTSLMAVIPLLYHHGFEVCALPSSLLSSNTCYEGYRILETDDFMKECLAHWQELRLKFSAIYSGFLGNAGQCRMVAEMIELFGKEDALVLVDPVMADEGELYSCYDHSMVEAMRFLISKADIITPNYTEACFLAGVKAEEEPQQEHYEEIFGALHSYGAKEAIITSAPAFGGKSCIFYSLGKGQEIRQYDIELLPEFFTGAGDMFSTLILSYTLKGMGKDEAIKKAADFIYKAIVYSRQRGRDGRSGVLLHQLLSSDEKEI